VKVAKEPLPASVVAHQVTDIIKPQHTVILLHTRAATQGEPSNPNNNHPIYYKNGTVLIHNGVIHNDDTLKRIHNLHTDGEVDSEIILALYNHFGSKSKVKRIKKVISKLRGTMAFALYDYPFLFLYRHSNPLSLMYVPEWNAILFASEKEMLERLVTETITYFNLFTAKKPVTKAYFHEMKNDELLVINFETQRIDKDKAETESLEFGGWYGGIYGGRKRNWKAYWY
ncbi:MAG: hypothetical protein JRD89_18860, partial [Deltaproteobacteria bacterium]|nr:hypothetical protein [Deltaproteobacteria bacterium]